VIDHEDRCTSKQQGEEPATGDPCGEHAEQDTVAATVPSQPKPEVDLTAPKQKPKLQRS
jgi:hypothetical protein